MAARGDAPAQRAALLEQVLNVLVVGSGGVVGRQVRVDGRVGDVQVEPVAETLQVFQGQLLHLMGRVAALEVRPQRPALDGLGQDDRGLPGVGCRRRVRGVELLVVVPAALQRPDLVPGPVLHQGRCARVTAEEVVADELAVLGFVGLEVAVRGDVHQVDQGALVVLCQQVVPLPPPDDLDDVPAGTSEEGLEFLDDLAVASDRTVQALQVAVDDECQVVQVLPGGEPDGAQRFGLVGFAVAQKRPHALLGRVLDATVLQVSVEPRLIDRVQGTEPHRDRRELPEVRHQPRVRVRRQTTTGMRQLLTEAVELMLGEASFKVGARVEAGGGMALEEDLIAAAGVVLAAEEVVEADLVQRRRRGVGRDVPAHSDPGTLGAVDHDGGVPAQVGTDATLDALVPREQRLPFRRDRVDVVGAAQGRDPDVSLSGSSHQGQHQEPGAGRAHLIHQAVEGVQPLLGLFRVGVDVLVGQPARHERRKL